MELQQTKNTAITWMKRHKAWLIFGGIALAIIIFIASSKQAATDETYIVARKDVALEAVLSGRTKSGSQVDLGFADSGRVASVSVSEGDRVPRGKTLASLELGDLYAELAQAQSDVIIAESGAMSGTTNLDKIIAEQDTLVANAEKTLYSAGLEAVPKDSATAAAAPIISGDYTGAEGKYAIRVYSSGAQTGSSFEVSGIENNYRDDLSTEHAVPLGSKGLYIQFPAAAGYANTEWIVNIPNTRSSSYTANRNAYLAAVATRDRVIAEARQDVAGTSGMNSVLQAKVAQAKAKVDGIQSRIAKRLIVAPFSGIVATVALEKGQTSSAASTITLISDSDYEVVAKVPELDIGKLRVGATAAIKLDAYPDEVFPGKIVSINPAETIVDGVPVYETKVIFDPLDSRVRSGMTATVKVVTSIQKQVIAIPSRFVATSNGETLVSVRTDTEPRKQPVTLGLYGSDGVVEVTAGLSEGDVIIAPQTR